MREHAGAGEAYYRHLVENGTAAAFSGDVRRGKALARVLTRITITDPTGAVVSLDGLFS